MAIDMFFITRPFVTFLCEQGWAGLGATISLDTQVENPNSDDALLVQVCWC